MKVFLMLDDNDILDRRNILLVGKEEDAKLLVECGYSDVYEPIEVCDHKDVEEIYLDYTASG